MYMPNMFENEMYQHALLGGQGQCKKKIVVQVLPDA